MEQPLAPASSARRNEDIALDLLRFVAATTGVARATGTATTGFTSGSTAKPEDQVTQLLQLYTRCLNVVSGETETRKTTTTSSSSR